MSGRSAVSDSQVDRGWNSLTSSWSMQTPTSASHAPPLVFVSALPPVAGSQASAPRSAPLTTTLSSDIIRSPGCSPCWLSSLHVLSLSVTADEENGDFCNSESPPVWDREPDCLVAGDCSDGLSGPPEE